MDRTKLLIVLLVMLVITALLAGIPLLLQQPPASAPAAAQPETPAAAAVSPVVEAGKTYLPFIFRNFSPGSVWQPAPGTTWQWQLSGEIDPSIDVHMYDIDLFDAPQATIDRLRADGRKVICYFSAGTFEEGRPDSAKFPDALKGNDVAGWPGEKWLDVRQMEVLAPIMAARLDLAVLKGCDGVEPDNVDGFSNPTGFPLTPQDQLNFNIWIADQAHTRGLSVGLKNNLGQVNELLPYFDWALNEQCFQFNECDALLPFIQAGKAVFGVEYELEAEAFCPLANAAGFQWLKKHRELDAWLLACQ